ncbi:MAG: TadE/TadG family type IV pilus assembly protein [Chloroflexales bacterium]
MGGAARHAGQSLAEFSLVIGLLLFIICGSCDAVQLALTTISVTEAASTAAHQAALIGGDDGPEGTVVQTARAVLATGITTRFGQATVQVVCQTPCQRYQPITVTVVFEDARWFPIISPTLRVERQAVRAAEKDQSVPLSLP